MCGQAGVGGCDEHPPPTCRGACGSRADPLARAEHPYLAASVVMRQRPEFRSYRRECVRPRGRASITLREPFRGLGTDRSPTLNGGDGDLPREESCAYRLILECSCGLRFVAMPFTASIVKRARPAADHGGRISGQPPRAVLTESGMARQRDPGGLSIVSPERFASCLRVP